jgi:hypothetical protein
MAGYHATVQSRRSATETFGYFGYLATFSDAAEWDSGVLAEERLDPGPAGVGSRFRLVVPFLGRAPTIARWPRRRPRTHPKLAQAGRDSVAAAWSSLRGGRDDRAAA